RVLIPFSYQTLRDSIRLRAFLLASLAGEGVAVAQSVPRRGGGESGLSFTTVVLVLSVLGMAAKICYDQWARKQKIQKAMDRYFSFEEARQFRQKYGKEGIEALINPRFSELDKFMVHLEVDNPLKAYEIWLFYHKLHIADRFFEFVVPI